MMRRQHTRLGNSRPVVIGVAVLATIVVAGIAFWIVRSNGSGDTPSDPGEEMSQEERLEIYRQVQMANAMLENEFFIVREENGVPLSGYVASEKVYDQLQTKLPSERLFYVNRAISRYQYMVTTNFDLEPEKKPLAIERAKEAIQGWLEQEPDCSEALWMLATTIRFETNRPTDEVGDLLKRAAANSPDKLAFQMSFFDISTYPNFSDYESAGRESLKRAYEIAPTNIVVALAYVKSLIEQQSPDARAVLLTLEPDVRASANSDYLEGTNRDPIPYYEDALRFLEEGEFNRAKSMVARFQNVIKGESYRHAAGLVEPPNALVFMVHELSDEFMDAFEAESLNVTDPIAVRFETFAPTGDEGETLDQSNDLLGGQLSHADIRDCQLADFDIDTKLELLVLTNDALLVIDEIESARPIISTRLDLTASYSGMLLADLDRDRISTDPASASADESGNVSEQSDAEPTMADDDDLALNEDVAFDEDNADVDVVLWGAAGIRVLRNEYNEADNKRYLADVEQAEALRAMTGVTAATFADIEADADLDLVFSTSERIHIFLHSGEKLNEFSFQFVDHSSQSLLPELDGPMTSMKLVDWDRDVDVDIVCADASGQQIGLLENLRHGRFEWQSLASLLDGSEFHSPLTVIEADGNMSWDLIGSSSNGGKCLLTTTMAGRQVSRKRIKEFGEQQMDGCCTPDFDNDGFQDVVAWAGDNLFAFRGAAEGEFRRDDQVWTDAATALSGITKVVDGDIDGDGDLDLVIAHDAGIAVLSNQGGNENRWLTISAIGDEDNAGRSNHHAIGSMIELKTGQRYQAQPVRLQRNHFGLGQREAPDVVRFMWTNGMPQTIVDVATDIQVQQVMYLKGSCPFVYTWTGEEYEFLTDCLWAAPLGLQQAEGILAPSRSWEYLKIPGERLVPIEGEYRIQLTEELWEAAYFDVVELIAIDHPADVDIYSNEKVGPPSIAEYRVHTVSDRRNPIAATDQDGNDVLSTVSKRDGEFFRGFDQRYRQGLTPPHHLELDLGEIDSSAAITLFLTGWIEPTDTSLNIAFSQNPGIDAPQLPAIWVADGEQGWKLLERPMGFPGGKTKTIAVDLTGAFTSNDCRIQIRTTAEIYWDEAFFTVDEPMVSLQTTRLAVSRADLHYRGFSRRHPHRRNHPETFDYSIVETDPKWPPMRGHFTRYGDVQPLLLAEDDQMAVLGSGDEMTVHFEVPQQPVPEGWTRDFFLYCVGWDKDADLNTVYGQTVEPLPHQNMDGYPYGADHQYPTSAEHEVYLRQYQTRTASFGRFWKGLELNPNLTQEE